MSTKHLVVIGNGMAGMACVDAILKKKPDFKITVLGEEPHCNYNRILLSSVLAGEKNVDDIYINTPKWYEENGIDLRLNTKAVRVDARNKTVFTEGNEVIAFDLLLFATGSNPFIPPMEGVDKKGVFVFRNIKDCQGIISYCQPNAKAVVIGGGLLGLEAAKGISVRGVQTSVVHLSDSLMEMQVDATGGEFLKSGIENLGIQVRLNTLTQRILGNGKVQGVEFKDGTSLEADIVVVACGIRPNVDLAKQCGLTVGRGIVVNDFMETSDSSIFAVGECVEHRGQVYGLVAPLWDQGKILAETITGNKGPTYQGSVVATKLKVAGVDVFSAGIFKADQGTAQAIIHQDPILGVYKKLIVDKDRLIGAVLVGDSREANYYLDLIRSEKSFSEASQQALLKGKAGNKNSEDQEDVMAKPDTEVICGCIGVSKGQIMEAIREKGLKSFSEVKSCTKASTGCGTCACLVEGIVKHVAGGEFQEERKDVLCECVPFEKQQIRTIIQTQKLKTVQDVLEVYGNGIGCASCKPALSYILDEANCGDYLDDRSARFINDRVHANIQRDGTFSVVPRMRGGVTSPDELRKIADVADKYNVPMVKVTGSQRLDLLGVKKQDLPKIWKDLGMPSGHAYAKAVRMVKTCVGTDFCRYGTQNSIQTGIQLERDLEGLYTPAKVKMGVVGCPRNCAEVTVKDIGLIGIEGGWQVVIGGGAGKKVREADLFTTVNTSDEALRVSKLFFQHYRENGNYLERTYDYVERVGMPHIRRNTILAPKRKQEALLERLAKSKAKVVEPWATESKQPVHPSQFEHFVLPKEKEALICQ